MKTAAAALLLALTLTGCGSDSDSAGGATATETPSATSEAPKGVTVDIVVADGKVTPLAKKVEAKVGEPITLHVTSDAAEEIHVHSDPEHEYEVAAGGDETFTFTIETPGQVAVEAHNLDVTIVELVVRPLILPAALAEHGVGGGATDLPIPLMFAMVGASWALALSFAMLVVEWKEPRFTRPDVDPETPEPPPRRGWLAVVGLLLTAWFMLALLAGPADETNSALGWMYILMWVGLVPLALLAGHVWRDLSPWRTIQAVLGRVTGNRNGLLSYPARLGYWPAAAGLLAFAWLELASPDPADVTTVRLWVAFYVAAMLLGGWVFGPTWFDRADPFDVYSAIVSRLSPFVRDGRFALHNPLRTLPTIPVAPGLVAVLGTLLGSTAFDSFSASTSWQSRSVSGLQQSATLLGFCVLVATLFTLATRASGGLSPERRRALPGLLAHTLVPIVVGYITAHYATYLLEKGQSAFIAMLDPLGRGWEPLGDPATSYFLSQHVSLLALLKVGAVVTGHVLAVIAAHDRALALLPKAHRLSGQLALLVLMVAYTFTGLYLLFST